MTDDVSGGAAAPADSAPVADAEVVHTPNPISTEPAPPSIDDALSRAEAKVKAEAAKDTPAPVKSETKTEAKADTKAETKPVESKPEVKRDETGKFASDKPVTDAQKAASEPAPKPAAEQAKSVSDAPARFSDDAKAIWKDAPEAVRRETERAIKELTQGHEKYRASAEKFEALKEFDEMATKSGTDLKTALTRYVNIEQTLRQDPIKGLQAVCENMGLSLRDVAAHIMGQTPEQQASQSDATIRDLKQQVAALTEQLGGVTQTIKQQRESATHEQIAKFAADNPRFDELSDDIAFFLKSGRTNDLSEAYKLAERLNPAPVQAAAEPPASSAANIDLVAQTQKGSKSINGAPSHGSSPAARKPSKSLDESLDRAFAALG